MLILNSLKIRIVIKSQFVLTWALFGPYWAPVQHYNYVFFKQAPPRVYRVKNIAEMCLYKAMSRWDKTCASMPLHVKNTWALFDN